jgi:glc operon protein GlcG
MNWQRACGTTMMMCFIACLSGNSPRATESASGPSSAIIRPPALNPDAALAMVEACRAFAKKNNWHVAIAVVDASGGLMAFFRMENTSFNAIQSAQLKAKTSAIVKSSTKDLADMVTSSANPALVAAHQLALGFYTAQGGLPIFVEGVVIGAVAAAGQGPAEDEQCARAGLEAGLNQK